MTGSPDFSRWNACLGSRILPGTLDPPETGTPDTNLPSNVQELDEACAAVNRTYPRDHTLYAAVRVPSWSSWLV
jgi:hypothetical protein